MTSAMRAGTPAATAAIASDFDSSRLAIATLLKRKFTDGFKRRAIRASALNGILGGSVAQPMANDYCRYKNRETSEQQGIGKIVVALRHCGCGDCSKVLLVVMIRSEQYPANR